MSRHEQNIEMGQRTVLLFPELVNFIIRDVSEKHLWLVDFVSCWDDAAQVSTLLQQGI